MKALIRHLATWANGPWSCYLCGYVFNSDAEGAAHMQAAHPDQT